MDTAALSYLSLSRTPLYSPPQSWSILIFLVSAVTPGLTVKNLQYQVCEISFLLVGQRIQETVCLTKFRALLQPLTAFQTKVETLSLKTQHIAGRRLEGFALRGTWKHTS